MISATGRMVVPSEEYLRAVSQDSSTRDTRCLVCGYVGTRVFPATMRNHVGARYWPLIDDSYRFSSNAECSVIYYSNIAGIYFFSDEIKTPCALKGTDSPRPVCYCMGITEEDIRM